MGWFGRATVPDMVHYDVMEKNRHLHELVARLGKDNESLLKQNETLRIELSTAAKALGSYKQALDTKKELSRDQAAMAYLRYHGGQLVCTYVNGRTVWRYTTGGSHQNGRGPTTAVLAVRDAAASRTA